MAIFQAVISNVTSSGDTGDVKDKCLEILRSRKLFKSAGRCSCGSLSGVNKLELDEEELTGFSNESVWNLLDFYLLSKMAKGNSSSDDVKLLNQAAALLPAMNVGLFSLYYRLSFSQFLVRCKLEQASSSLRPDDIADMLANLQLNDGTKPASKPGRRGRPKVASKKNTSTVDEELKAAVSAILKNLQEYQHLRFYPWYRSTHELIGSLYLHDARGLLHSNKSNCSTVAAAHLLESFAVSFRNGVLAKEK